ncbi:hypothetical protein EVAR_28012_1 [Eumeta japonica]|uniref:Uncharacterized protein n=1 Tax=Eumeta variegata TaxID=151549 RepID=A0A4C1WB73_EUMVA|nr:hypothetical protein EVAR_28012_1 [Eumeta japonica]
MLNELWRCGAVTAADFIRHKVGDSGRKTGSGGNTPAPHRPIAAALCFKRRRRVYIVDRGTASRLRASRASIGHIHWLTGGRFVCYIVFDVTSHSASIAGKLMLRLLH